MAETVGELQIILRMVAQQKSFTDAKKAIAAVSKIGTRGGAAMKGLATGARQAASGMRGAAKSTRNASSSMSRMSQKTTSLTQEMNKMGKALNGIGFSFRRLLLYYGAYKGLKGMVETISQFQQLKQQLITVEQNAGRAETQWKRLMEFATTTPFTLDKVISGFIKMRNVGMKPTDEQMTALGDMAAGWGVTFDEIGFALARAAGGVTRPLKKFIPSIKKLANADAFMIEGKKVANTPEALLNAVAKIGQQKFAGGMERQLNTIGGAWSLVTDNLAKFFALVGEAGFADAMVEFSTSLRLAIGDSNEWASSLGALLGGMVRLGNAIFKFFDKHKWIRNALLIVLVMSGLKALMRAMIVFTMVTKMHIAQLLLEAAAQGNLNAMWYVASEALKLYWANLTRLVTSMWGLVRVQGAVALGWLKAIWPIVLGIALAVGLLLAMEDFYAFMDGRNSVFGRIFENGPEWLQWLAKGLLLIVGFFDVLTDLMAFSMSGLIMLGQGIAWLVGLLFTKAVQAYKFLKGWRDKFLKAMAEGFVLLFDPIISFFELFLRSVAKLAKMIFDQVPDWAKDFIVEAGSAGKNFMKAASNTGQRMSSAASGAADWVGDAIGGMSMGSTGNGAMQRAASYQAGHGPIRQRARSAANAERSMFGYASPTAEGQAGASSITGSTLPSIPGYSIFNIAINEAGRSTEEVGRELGKEINRNLEGRKQ
jgi:hypothetical protein